MEVLIVRKRQGRCLNLRFYFIFTFYGLIFSSRAFVHPMLRGLVWLIDLYFSYPIDLVLRFFWFSNERYTYSFSLWEICSYMICLIALVIHAILSFFFFFLI